MLWGLRVWLLASGLAIAWLPVEASASNCTDLRQQIVALDAGSSQLAGYLPLRFKLASLYSRLCSAGGRNPASRDVWWYDINGKALQAFGSGNRPNGGAYMADKSIGDACTNASNPSMCALFLGAKDVCGGPPPNADTQKACEIQGAYPTSEASDSPLPELPAPMIEVNGSKVPIDDYCYVDVNNLVNLDAASLARRKMEYDSYVRGMQRTCSPLLSAIEQKAGVSATQDPARFLAAFKQTLLPAFSASPSASPTGNRVPFELCHQAQTKACVCKKHWDEIASVGSKGGGDNGQARAFGDCYGLYSSVAGMCGLESCPSSVPPLKQSMPAAPPTQKPPGTTGASMPPQPNDPATARRQQAVAQLSPQCRGQLNDLFQGADSGDRDKASKAYDSLRGQCDGQVRALAGAEGMALPERIMTERSQRLMGRAMSGDVGRVPSTAEAVAQNGGSFDTGEVLEFSLTLLNVLSGVAGVYAAMPGGAAARFGSNMGSIGNRPVRSTYGQGAPANRPAPPSHQSDITGTGR